MIAAITVTYQPDIAAMQRQFVSLQGQVSTILVIDNGSDTYITDKLQILCINHGVKIYLLERNTGIAHAQNIGIQHAKNLCAETILLLDQDSEATPGMVDILLTALHQDSKIAAVGPQSIDQRTKHSSFLIDRGIWPRSWIPNQIQPQDPIEVGFLIASGTLIHTDRLDSNSPMLGDWFIDHIDTEWCLRMRAKGWKLLGVPNAHLMHRLGDKVSQIWFLRTRQVAHHSPLRDYYMFRNSILLCALPTTPWRWKLYFLTRLVQFAGFFLPFAPQRALRLRRMVRGVFDGLRGRTGPYQ